MKTTGLILSVVVLLSIILGVNMSDYRSIHFNALVADGHNDVLLRVMNGEDISVRTEIGHTDLPRLKEGGVDFQWFAVWVSPVYLPDRSFKRANEMIDALESIAKKNPDHIAIVRNYSEALSVMQQGKIAAAMGMEGGHPLEDSIEKLEHFYNRGVRYLAPTWNNSTSWATSSADETHGPEKLEFKGLTEFGKKIIRRMDELGIIIDVSHVGEQTIKDILETTKNPVIASHSGVYALAPHHRNLKDEQIKAIAQNGGVICVVFYPGFLTPDFDRKYRQILREHDAEIQKIRQQYKDDYAFWNARAKIVEPYVNEIRPSADVVIDHIDYIVNLVGINHVGLGSDYDGITVTPKGLEDVTTFPTITKKLLGRGYSEDDVRKILGGNLMQVFKKVTERK